MIELLIVVVVGTSIWVAFDASANGLSPWQWGLGCLLLWIVAFPLYLVERSKVKRIPARADGAPVSARSEGRWEPDPADPERLERWREGSKWTRSVRARQAP